MLKNLNWAFETFVTHFTELLHMLGVDILFQRNFLLNLLPHISHLKTAFEVLITSSLISRLDSSEDLMLFSSNILFFSVQTLL